MRQPLMLAVDIGSSSVRAGLFDRAGTPRGAVARRTYALRSERPGQAEVDPATLLGMVEAVIGETLGQAPADTIAGVAVSSFWHSLLGLNAEGQPTTAVLSWADTRASAAAASLRARDPAGAIHRITGAPLHASFWPAKLAWLAETAPEVLARTRHVVSAVDFILLRFFGSLATSISMASGTGLFDQSSCRWSDEALAFARLDAALLPEVRSLPFGGLQAPYAGRWPQLAGVPWFGPYGDGACMNVGAGCVDDSALVLMLGTSGSIRVVWEAGGITADDPALWRYRLDGRRAAGGMALSEGGNVAAWARANLGSLPDDQAVERALLTMRPGQHGLTVLPFIVGQRSPDWDGGRTAAMAGMTAATSPLDIYCALLESVAIRFAVLKDRLDAHLPRRRRVVATGTGFTRSPGWAQLVATHLGEAIHVCDVEEGSLRGAAIMGLEAAGLIGAIGDLHAPIRNTVEPDRALAEAARSARSRHTEFDALLRDRF